MCQRVCLRERENVSERERESSSKGNMIEFMVRWSKNGFSFPMSIFFIKAFVSDFFAAENFLRDIFPLRIGLE